MTSKSSMKITPSIRGRENEFLISKVQLKMWKVEISAVTHSKAKDDHFCIMLVVKLGKIQSSARKEYTRLQVLQYAYNIHTYINFM